MARRWALDLVDGRSTGIDRVERGPQKINQTRASLRRVITVRFAATWQHHTRRSRGTRIIKPHQRTCLIGSVITVQIRSRRKHLERRMKIQRTRFKAFYNASWGIQSGPLIKIGWSRLNRNGPRWTVLS